MLLGGRNIFVVLSSLVAACVETPPTPADPNEPGMPVEPIDPPTEPTQEANLVGCNPATPAADVDLSGVWIAPGGAVWTVGSDGSIGVRTNGAWKFCKLAGDASYNAVWGAADDDVWIAGAEGTLLRWRGSTLDRIDVGTSASLESLWGASATDVFVVGDGGVVRHFDGATWQTADVAVDKLDGVWGASASDVWIAGQRHFTTTLASGTELNSCEAHIYRWNPSTHTFVSEAAFLQQHGECAFVGLGGSSGTDIWAVGREFPAGAAAPFAFAVHRDASGWTRATPPDEDLTIDRTYTDVAPRAPGAESGAWVVAAGVTAVRIDGASSSAADAITSDLFDIDARGDVMYAVGASGKILRWNDAGWLRER
jgi:hypothetical protein